MTSKFEKLLQKGQDVYSKYTSVCDNICAKAQKYVDWEHLRWEWYPNDGLCFGIEGEYIVDGLFDAIINDISIVPADMFFDIVDRKGKVTPLDFINNTI